MCLPEDLGGMREELCRALGLFGGGGNLVGQLFLYYDTNEKLP